MGNCILTRRGGGAWVGIPNFTYTGTYETVDDGDGNWRIKFLTSGIFTLLKPKQLLIDVFCVGGGGGVEVLLLTVHRLLEAVAAVVIPKPQQPSK